MKFFLDSADLEILRPFMKTGVFHGVTTNPTILEGLGIEGDALRSFAHKVVDIGAQEVFFQSWGTSGEDIYQNGKRLSSINPKVVVKVPCTREGLEAAALLVKDGVRICLTAIYAAYQILLASSVGAFYAAPYLGRMKDAGRDGHALISQMVDMTSQEEQKTNVLAASVRSIEDIVTLAQNGVRYVTLSPKLAMQLFDEPLTIEAVKNFESDAAKMQLPNMVKEWT